MGNYIFDRVQETTIGTGAGALALAGATTRMFRFVDAGIPNGGTFIGLIENSPALEWELSLCKLVTGSPNNITRQRLLRSSTSGFVDFSAGTKTVSLVEPVAPKLRTMRTVTSGTTTTMTWDDFEVVINKGTG